MVPIIEKVYISHLFVNWIYTPTFKDFYNKESLAVVRIMKAS